MNGFTWKERTCVSKCVLTAHVCVYIHSVRLLIITLSPAVFKSKDRGRSPGRRDYRRAESERVQKASDFWLRARTWILPSAYDNYLRALSPITSQKWSSGWTGLWRFDPVVRARDGQIDRDTDLAFFYRLIFSLLRGRCNVDRVHVTHLVPTCVCEQEVGVGEEVRGRRMFPVRVTAPDRYFILHKLPQLALISQSVFIITPSLSLSRSRCISRVWRDERGGFRGLLQMWKRLTRVVLR